MLRTKSSHLTKVSEALAPAIQQPSVPSNGSMLVLRGSGSTPSSFPLSKLSPLTSPRPPSPPPPLPNHSQHKFYFLIIFHQPIRLESSPLGLVVKRITSTTFESANDKIARSIRAEGIQLVSQLFKTPKKVIGRALWRSGYRASLESLFLRERRFESCRRRFFPGRAALGVDFLDPASWCG